MANSWLTRAIDRFRKPAAQPKPAPANELDVVTRFVAGRPVPVNDWDPRTLMDEGYRHNVIVYCCVNEIASSAAAPRVYLRDRKTQGEVEGHPLLDLLARPAPGLSWYELIETLLIHQQVAGEGYLHKGRNASGEIIQLKPARPDRIQPVPDRQGNVLYYEYKVDSEAYAPQRIETKDLALLRLPDPLNDFHGLSPLSVAAVFGDIDTAAALYLRDFFANGAMPMGLLKFKTPAVRREDRLRVQQEWAEQYGTGEIAPQRKTRWHNVGVLGGDVEYQAIATEPAQLRLDAVWGMSESRLCATFGVPPSIIQARIGLQFNTYSNAESARRSFWTETLGPIYRRISDGLTRHIVSEYDENLELVFDLESIPELQEDLNARVERASKLFLNGLASFNEARTLSDLDEVKTDYFWKPSTGALVRREDVESGKIIEDAEKAKEAAQQAMAGGGKPGLPPNKSKSDEGPPREDEDEEERQALPFDLLGLGTMPHESEREIQRATDWLQRGFSAAVHEGIESSNLEALSLALKRGDWRAAERAVAIDRFISHYGRALDSHLRAESSVAAELHLKHHSAPDREGAAYKPLHAPAGTPKGGQFISPGGGGSVNLPPTPQTHRIEDYDTERRYKVNGEWTPERQALHQKILDDIFADKKPSESPVVRMMGGGPAAGKGTIRGEMLTPNMVLIDADEIRKQLPEYGEMLAGDKSVQKLAAVATYEESSHIVSLALKRGSEGKHDMLYDGTGDGKYEKLVSKLDGFKAGGAKIEAVYTTRDISSALEGARKRAERTGRWVPDSVIVETHKSVSRVFPRVTKSGKLDSWRLFDNNVPLGEQPRLIAEGLGKRRVLYDRAAYAAFLRKARG